MMSTTEQKFKSTSKNSRNFFTVTKSYLIQSTFSHFLAWGPFVQVGNAMNSSQSYATLPLPSGLQHDQYFLRSWNIGSPVWYEQASSPFSSSIKCLIVQPLFAHINLPSLFNLAFFSTWGAGPGETKAATSAALFSFSSCSLLKSAAVLTRT